MSVAPAISRLRQALLCVAAGLSLLTAAEALQFDPVALERRAVAAFGSQGAHAIRSWVSTLVAVSHEPIDDQLRMVNDFWNRNVRSVEDPQIWNQADYWATPLETLGRGAGDCEDFVIGKYFSLVRLGVSPEKLRLIYVRARVGGMGSSQSIAHMVLGYYPTPESTPLVLDNLMGSIVPADERTDLQPVFSFNATGVYVGANASGPVERISRWQDLLARMRAQGFRP